MLRLAQFGAGQNPSDAAADAMAPNIIAHQFAIGRRPVDVIFAVTHAAFPGGEAAGKAALAGEAGSEDSGNLMEWIDRHLCFPCRPAAIDQDVYYDKGKIPHNVEFLFTLHFYHVRALVAVPAPLSHGNKMKQPSKKRIKKSASGRTENARIHENALALLVNMGNWQGAKQILKCALALLERFDRRPSGRSRRKPAP
jgi:hypothetical protein